MKKISATELNRRPGAAIDAALREGHIAITKWRQLAALLAREAPALVAGLEWQTATATQLVTDPTILTNTHNNTGIYQITRQGTIVAYLLPRMYLDELGLEL